MDGKTYFSISADFSSLDEKIQKFIMLRNELAILADEIGVEVRCRLFELNKD